MAQWQSTGGSSQRCPGFNSRRLPGFYTFLYFRLVTSKFIYISIDVFHTIAGCLENPSSSFTPLLFPPAMGDCSDLCLHPDSKWQQWRLYSMGYLHLAFGAGNTSGMNVSCNLNELLPVHMCFNVIRWTLQQSLEFLLCCFQCSTICSTIHRVL